MHCSVRGSVLAARLAAAALASLTLLAIGVSGLAEPVYPSEAAVVTTLALEPDASQPMGLAVNSSTGRIYVSNAESDNVSVIDDANSTVIATIPVGHTPRGIAVNAKENRVYVANSGSNEVTVIDGESNEVIATVAVGEEPWDLAADPGTGRVFVSDSRSDTLSVIDGRYNRVIRTMSVGPLPTGVAVDPNTSRVYVASGGSGYLKVVDGISNVLTAISPLAGGSSARAWDVAVESSSNRVYVATSGVDPSNADAGTVVVIDASNYSVIDFIAVASPAEALAVDSASGRIYVGSSSDDRMWAIDAHTNVVTSAVGLEGGLSAVDVDQASGRVYAAHADDSSLSFVSWMPGVTLAGGWTYACYFGDEQPLDDALAAARDHVLAAYRLGPDGSYDRWFPGEADLSTISTVRPREALFVLADDYAPWEQEPSQGGSDFTLAPGWNSICYSGETREAAVAVGEMSDEIAVAYSLAPDGIWRRFVSGRPELTDMGDVQSFSPLMVSIPIPQPPTPTPQPTETPPAEQEVSEEFLALQAVLEDRIRNYYGDVAICVTDLQTDEKICVNGDALHRTGCTINMFALFVAVEEFEAGRANPDDWAYWIKIGIGHSSPPQVAVFVEGIKGSLEEGVKRARELMESWGLKDSVFGYVPGYPGRDWQPNILTARETNMILVKLYRGELFSPEWTSYTIDRLLDIKPGLNYILPLFLPPEVRVAHKIGYHPDADGWVYNDVGIVMMQRGDQQVAYVISYLSQGMPSEYAAYIFGAELSKVVYDWFGQRY
jgi:YVTN family beta-propeller protein